jgi:hypothetical protein
VHPLLALLMYPPVFLLSHLLVLPKETAAHLSMSLLAGAWVAGTYVLGRVLGCRTLDSVLLALLAGTSAAAMFVFVVPELHAHGGVSLLVCLIFAASVRRRRAPDSAYVAVHALSASVTVTNWILGALIALRDHRPWRFVRITLLAGALLFGVSLLQRQFFPSAGLVLHRSAGYATLFTYAPTPERIGECLAAFFFSPSVMPEIGTVQVFSGEPVGSASWPYAALSVQSSSIGSGSTLGWLASGLWAAMLALGVFAWWRKPDRDFVLPLALLAQLGLYLVYGEETFLYALNWLPFLIAFVALALTTPLRTLALALLVPFLVVNTFNNVRQFRVAASMIEHPELHGSMQRPDSFPPTP